LSVGSGGSLRPDQRNVNASLAIGERDAVEERRVVQSVRPNHCCFSSLVARAHETVELALMVFQSLGVALCARRLRKAQQRFVGCACHRDYVRRPGLREVRLVTIPASPRERMRPHQPRIARDVASDDRRHVSDALMRHESCKACTAAPSLSSRNPDCCGEDFEISSTPLRAASLPGATVRSDGAAGIRPADGK
jgi:hypothetical protein